MTCILLKTLQLVQQLEQLLQEMQMREIMLIFHSEFLEVLMPNFLILKVGSFHFFSDQTFLISEDAEQNGVVRILTRAEFDYEAKANKFFFELQASSGQLSSTVPVRIHVSDVNDNKPALKDFVILMNRFDNVQMARQIGFIPAFDPDQNATLEYFLEENDLIEAEKYTGKILVKQEWKRNMDVSFKTCVSDGANTECSTCRFIHVLVEPEWLSESFTLSLARMTVDDFWDPLVFQRFRFV